MEPEERTRGHRGYPHIPAVEAWAAMPGIRSAAGAKCRFNILLGQYDSGNRVCMERYGVANR